MEPTTAATPSAAVPTPVQTAPARPALPRPVMWTALAVAAALPFVLLTTLIIVMIACQYNILNWME